MLVARRAELLDGLAEELGARAHPLPADLSVRADRAALPDRIAELGLLPDILVNNAGLATSGPIAKSVVTQELNLVEVDVAAVVDLCCRLVPGMVERGRGAVLNVASVGAFGLAGAGVLRGGEGVRALLHRKSARRAERKRRHRGNALPGSGPHRISDTPPASVDADAAAALPTPLWKTADDVARAAIEGLDADNGVIVPGGLNRAAALLYRLAPRSLLLPVLARNHPGLRSRGGPAS